MVSQVLKDHKALLVQMDPQVNRVRWGRTAIPVPPASLDLSERPVIRDYRVLLDQLETKADVVPLEQPDQLGKSGLLGRLVIVEIQETRVPLGQLDSLVLQDFREP